MCAFHHPNSLTLPFLVRHGTFLLFAHIYVAANFQKPTTQRQRYRRETHQARSRRERSNRRDTKIFSSTATTATAAPAKYLLGDPEKVVGGVQHRSCTGQLSGEVRFEGKSAFTCCETLWWSRLSLSRTGSSALSRKMGGAASGYLTNPTDTTSNFREHPNAM